MVFKYDPLIRDMVIKSRCTLLNLKLIYRFNYPERRNWKGEKIQQNNKQCVQCKDV